MSAEPDQDGGVLFCPFCRECFEGVRVCPEHELTLVPFQSLPRQAHEREVRWDEAVMPWEVRFGRLEIVLGVVALLVGFAALPLVEGSFDDQRIAWTALEIATSRAPNLWTVPFAAALFVVFLFRRRTPLEMRGARLAGVALALMPAISIGYSLWNIQRAVGQAHGAVALSPAMGAWVVGAACVLLLVGSARFGAVGAGRAEEALPHGAEPENDDGARGIEPERRSDVKAKKKRR